MEEYEKEKNFADKKMVSARGSAILKNKRIVSKGIYGLFLTCG
jgi:hypothetical protein